MVGGNGGQNYLMKKKKKDQDYATKGHKKGGGLDRARC